MKTAVCAIARLENKYLREWVEHYKKIGFDNIILYDNNDIDGERFEEVISDYIKSGFVIVENVRGEKDIQIKSYDLCYKKYSNNFDWIAFFDLDEFLNLNTYLNINHFLIDSRFANFNCIKVNWKNYDDNNLVKVENNDYSISRFIHPAVTVNFTTKCIVKTKIKECSIISAHGPLEMLTMSKEKYKGNIDNVLCCDVNGMPCKNKNIYVYRYKPNQVLLCHYRYKTLDEYIRFKSMRGYPERWKSYGLKLLTIDNFFTYNKLTREKYNYAKEIAKRYGELKVHCYFRIWLYNFRFKFIQYGWFFLMKILGR